MLTVTSVNKHFRKRLKAQNKFKNFFFPKFEDFHALQDISFDIKQGEKVAFIGPNGAGKSTTIKAILGILHYDEGNISLFGMNPKTHRKQIAKHTASVFGQRSQLLYHLPLIDSFKLFKIIYEIPELDFKKRLDHFVQKFQMEDLLHQPVRKLSLGQRMKGEIITSLLHGPKIIFLDEPTIGLDIIAKKVMYEVLLDIHKRENITIFLTSHDTQDVEALCDRSIVINKGKILYDGSLPNLMTTYGNKKLISYKDKNQIARETIEIENTPTILEKTIKHLFEYKDVEDVKIENIPLEDIIAQFYH